MMHKLNNTKNGPFLQNRDQQGHTGSATFDIFQVSIGVSGGTHWEASNVCMPSEDLGVS